MAEALINGQAYDFTNIQVNIMGVNVVGVSAINYSTTQEKTNNFGTGNEAVSRGKGAKEPSGNFELSMNDVENIRDAAPNRDLLDLPAFDIVLIYNNTGNPVRNHVLENVEFASDGVDTSLGDTDIRFTFDIAIGKVRYVA